MRHTYECTLRWADLDLVGHVNNVAYLDYLQEARIAFFGDHGVRATEGEGLVVARHAVEFAAPLAYTRRPVCVDTWVSDVRAGSFTLEHELYAERDGIRTTYVRAASRLAALVLDAGRPRRLTAEERTFLEGFRGPATLEPKELATGGGRHVSEIAVRWSDLDAFRHVNNVKYLEYFQEARLRYFGHLRQEGDKFGFLVIARSDVEYRREIRWRRAPYEVHSWVGRVGERSFTICAEIRDGDEVLAVSETVGVSFDRETQRSAPMPADQRARLLAELG